MRSISVVLSFSLLTAAYARVTFPYSEVLQLGDMGGTDERNQVTFNCADGCRAYSDYVGENLRIMQEGKIVATFANDTVIDFSEPFDGIELPAASNYMLQYVDRNGDFVFYVVSSEAPNYGSPVYVPQESGEAIDVDAEEQYVTFLTSAAALDFSNFNGSFSLRSPFPMIYGAGFDVISERLYGKTSCTPIYQARELPYAKLSTLSLVTAVITIDFGYTGVHSVTTAQHKDKNVLTTVPSSLVYMSPGYVGCPFAGGAQYQSSATSVKDNFIILADRLDIYASYHDIAASTNQRVDLRVNDDILDFFNSAGQPATLEKHYGNGAFNFALEWYRNSNANGWVMQVDVGMHTITATTTSAAPFTGTTPVHQTAPTTSSAGLMAIFTPMIVAIMLVL